MVAIAGFVVTAIGAAYSAYSSSKQADAAKKKASAASVGGMGAGQQGYTPTANGGGMQGGASSQTTMRQALGFDQQRREVGANQPAAEAPAMKTMASDTLPASAPPNGSTAPVGQGQLPQGQTFAQAYGGMQGQQPQGAGLQGGYGQSMQVPDAQQVGTSAQQPSSAGQYGQYAQIAGQLGQALMQRPGGGGAGIPHAAGGSYQPTAGQFARRNTY